MNIELKIRLEPVGTGWVWWADSPQLPGFSVAADHLPNLLARANEVIRREHLAPKEAKVTPCLVALHSSGSTAVNEAVFPSSTGPEQRQIIDTQAFVAVA